MSYSILSPKALLGIIALLLISTFSRASHTIGGEMIYQCFGANNYKITLTIYQDINQGDPIAIAEDNPAFIGIFKGNSVFQQFNNVMCIDSSDILPAIAASCVSPDTTLHYRKKVYSLTVNLPSSTSPYTIVYQRCCRNANTVNLNSSGDVGSTFFCTIPPSNIATSNNSAVFSSYPPEILLINYPFTIDHSATDADGDSLSYSFGPAFMGGDNNNAKPVPSPPPYDNVPYSYPYTYSNPLPATPALQIDATTGVITGTPNTLGRYLVTVYCDEWRSGVKINTITRDFEFVVMGNNFLTFHPFAGNDTTIIAGDSILFNASGGAQYTWSPATNLSDSTIYDPLGHYPVSGTYQYILTATDSAGCTGYDTINVNVAAIISLNIPNAFTPDNDGINDRFHPLRDNISAINSFKIFNRQGKLLYTGTGRSASWDGTYHGTMQAMGTYLWMLDYVDSKGKHGNASGQVTLIR